MTQAAAGISTNARAVQALTDLNNEADAQRAMVAKASRRGILGAALALPMVAAAATAQAQPSGLLALCAEHRRLNAKYRALDATKGTTDADYDALSERMTPLAERAVRTPATTLEELKAKAGLIADIYDGERPEIFHGPTGAVTMDCRLVESILRDLGVM